eukprot:438659-Ditylum_brightwellii.AAC.1
MLKSEVTPLKHYQELMGKLQHASFGIPGGAGLFSLLQIAMAGDPTCICLTPFIKEVLMDWKVLIKYMKSNPTSIHQLIKDYPAFVGYTDACLLRAGIWSSGLEGLSTQCGK